ncbi:hypothetical protein NOJ28_09285 [Neorhizobium galegae]|uniref:hypothetical protein n=1 Tax=Neorhizobium galegae TaxID=399 RepID=UPI000A934F1D|nr:hypothetical protein [Neorhizobium galegae]MCQ1765721.1 hypothetical protein [Neorhizobium galegae]MCQ1844635.1 hypothetical protein [Neorhizobium galegae]
MDGGDPVKELSEFLDHFYDRATDIQMVACFADEPIILKDEKLNALYGATAEYLSKRYRLSIVPAWVRGPHRFLREPWFTPSDDNLREYLTFTSPAEFRSRNIFTEATPLRRARTWQAEQRLEQRLTTPTEQEMQVSKLKSA